jgi:hypothetical protein
LEEGFPKQKGHHYTNSGKTFTQLNFQLPWNLYSNYCPGRSGSKFTVLRSSELKPNMRGYQYSETNVMQFLFSLLRIKGLYIFQALLAQPQEALHKRHLVYCLRVMSVGCTRIGVELI